MKPQDILFIIILFGLVFFKRNPKYFVWAGLLCLLLAMPLFHFWVFFTAERLVWYASGFIFLACIFLLVKHR